MRSAAVVVAVFVVSACVTDRVLDDDDGADDGVVTVNEDVVERTKQKTAQLRALPFTRDVPIEVLTVQQLEEWLNRYYDDYKVALKRQDYFYHRMGILPPSRDTASTWKGFLGGFAGGVYDDDRVSPDGNKGTMILVQDYAWWSKVQLDMIGAITGVDMAYEVFLAHELTHALQDQHFKLDALLDPAEGPRGDDDVRMVHKIALESEANVIGMAHFTGMRLDDVADRKSFFAFLRYNNLFNAPILTAVAGKTPSFFSRQTFAQYELGLDWVEARLDDGEWRQVVEGKGHGAASELALAYARVPGTPGALPASTEQLLFKDKEFDPPLHLARLPLDDDGRWAPLHAAGIDAVHAGGDVFGALALKHWLEVPFDGSIFGGAASAVAHGWGGDRYDVFVDDDDSPILLWRLRGDSDEDARELLRALRARFTRAYGEDRVVVDVDEADVVDAHIDAKPDERARVRTLRKERLRLERRGAAVVVVNGVGADKDVGAVVDALFAAAGDVVVDEDGRGAVARALQARLETATASVPPPVDMTPAERVLLPHRTMSFRLGAAGYFIDDAAFFVPDVEARWGVRENVELSLPGAVTVHVDEGPVALAFGVAPGLLPLLDPANGTWSARVNATALLADGPLGVVVQLETAPRFTLSALDEAEDKTAVRVGALLQPLPNFSIHVGVASEEDGAVVRVGGVVERGFVDAPVVEFEVVPGLDAYYAGAVGCVVVGDEFKGVRVFEQKHALGLLLYF